MSPSIALVIPARLGSTRLPRKVLLPWHQEAIIAHVAKGALAANLGPVFVACDSPEIAKALAHLPVQCIQTDSDLASGTDRVYQAIRTIDPEKKFDIIINIQGDIPTVTTEMIQGAIDSVHQADIGTVGAWIYTEEEIHNPAVVKIARDTQGQALYFSRSAIPHGTTRALHHIGIYAFKRPALEKFVSLAPSALENQERLEQLRALEARMTIHVSEVSTIPLSIDTPEDYERLLAL